MGSTADNTEESYGAVVYGKEAAKAFPIDPTYRNLNNGSFGTIPKVIQAKQRSYQDRVEARPDQFIRYEYPKLLDQSREAVAQLLHVPTDTCVFMPNATAAMNVILRNMIWAEDAKDEILYFSTIYGGCGKTIDYVVDTRMGRVSSRCIDLAYPMEDDEILALFRAAVQASLDAGKRPKMVVYDCISSQPGVKFPYEQITVACRELGIISVIDGAQGVGLIDLDLGKLQPDFFFSNCHKWLHVPRGCCVLYVPEQNQTLLPSSLPTSHGYVPKTGQRINPLPPSSKPAFVNNFEFVGTIDNAPYICVKDSIRWRQEALGGETKILEYTWELAREGGQRVAEMLGTKVLENKKGTLSSSMVNIELPLWAGSGPEGQPVVPKEAVNSMLQWIQETILADYNTFIMIYTHNGRWYTRLSAQVYLDMDDFEFAGKALVDVCGRAAEKVAKGDV